MASSFSMNIFSLNINIKLLMNFVSNYAFNACLPSNDVISD